MLYINMTYDIHIYNDIIYAYIICVYHMIHNIIDSDVIYVYICAYAYHVHIIYNIL